MLAMQYTIQLPPDYDPALIVKRVEHRSKLFDNLPGMVHKAFLYNDDDKLYAPFYVWEDLTSARDFLLDELFKGVIQSFRRPRVRDWVVLSQSYGNREIAPQFAIRETDRIPAEENLENMLERENSLREELLPNPNLYYYLTALDAERWEIIRYYLWKDAKSAMRPAGDCVQTYQVLHVSEPSQAAKQLGEINVSPFLAAVAVPAPRQIQPQDSREMAPCA